MLNVLFVCLLTLCGVLPGVVCYFVWLVSPNMFTVKYLQLDSSSILLLGGHSQTKVFFIIMFVKSPKKSFSSHERGEKEYRNIYKIVT